MNPWVQTLSGRAVSLADPQPGDIDFSRDVPEHLSRLMRFLGATSLPYSVAQHCVLGADHLAAAGLPNLAGYFLLHDAHEAYCGDITSPVAAALAPSALPQIKARLDAAIHAAAGLCWPLPQADAAIIAEIDLRMLATERRQLMARTPRQWLPAVEEAIPIRTLGRIRCWPSTEAADAWRNRFALYVTPHRRAA